MGRAQLQNGGLWIYIKPVCRIVCGRDATVVRVTPVSGVEGLGKESRGCVPVTPHTGRGLRLVCKQLNPDHGRAHREGAPEQPQQGHHLARPPHTLNTSFEEGPSTSWSQRASYRRGARLRVEAYLVEMILKRAAQGKWWRDRRPLPWSGRVGRYFS